MFIKMNLHCGHVGRYQRDNEIKKKENKPSMWSGKT